MSLNLIPQTPRPNRASRRSQQLGIDQSPNKHGSPNAFGAAPVQQQPVQAGISFAHNGAQMAMVITVGNQQMAVPMTPDQWESLAANGDETADKARAALAEPAVPPEPEPAAVYDDDEAVLIRQRIEECVVAYGKYRLYRAGIPQAFRHPNHMLNWALKHKLEIEPAADGCGDVTFFPATRVDQGMYGSPALRQHPETGGPVETPTAV